MTYTGGCSCGSVRFAIADYLYVLACHCQACKKRTGSAFGVSVVVDNASVTNLEGETKTFTRKAESGRSVDYEFCPNCGTTIRWSIKAAPNRKIFAGGAIDGMTQLTVAGEMYTETAIPWARLGCELSRSGEPDNEFRAALIEKSKQTPLNRIFLVMDHRAITPNVRFGSLADKPSRAKIDRCPKKTHHPQKKVMRHFPLDWIASSNDKHLNAFCSPAPVAESRLLNLAAYSRRSGLG